MLTLTPYFRHCFHFCPDHLKSCRSSHTKQRKAAGDIKSMKESMESFLGRATTAPVIEGISDNATDAEKDGAEEDDAESIDSLASGGIDCNENLM